MRHRTASRRPFQASPEGTRRDPGNLRQEHAGSRLPGQDLASQDQVAVVPVSCGPSETSRDAAAPMPHGLRRLRCPLRLERGTVSRPDHCHRWPWKSAISACRSEISATMSAMRPFFRETGSSGAEPRAAVVFLGQTSPLDCGTIDKRLCGRSDTGGPSRKLARPAQAPSDRCCRCAAGRGASSATRGCGKTADREACPPPVINGNRRNTRNSSTLEAPEPHPMSAAPPERAERQQDRHPVSPAPAPAPILSDRNGHAKTSRPSGRFQMLN